MSDLNSIPILDALGRWTNQELTISKQELGNNDETILTLEDAVIKEQQPDRDDYLAPTILQLRGDGIIVENEKSAALPYGTYDISLEEVADVQITDDLISFHTSKGQYRISSNNN
ncbi:hypothetical protein [Pseudalkalibacillus decolorationis]|uniref:hypothetical protein n=1 Tax=Pseudalkalibacillus decolorationis TaxID=163879 RepID=UPI0021495F23|nr:hypothetical protein [Pseudalkalibacillus decolorationis]